VHISGRPLLVRCDMSTNTPYWEPMRGSGICRQPELTGAPGEPAIVIGFDLPL